MGLMTAQGVLTREVHAQHQYEDGGAEPARGEDRPWDVVAICVINASAGAGAGVNVNTIEATSTRCDS